MQAVFAITPQDEGTIDRRDRCRGRALGGPDVLYRYETVDLR